MNCNWLDSRKLSWKALTVWICHGLCRIGPCCVTKSSSMAVLCVVCVINASYMAVVCVVCISVMWLLSTHQPPQGNCWPHTIQLYNHIIIIIIFIIIIISIFIITITFIIKGCSQFMSAKNGLIQTPLPPCQPKIINWPTSLLRS